MRKSCLPRKYISNRYRQIQIERNKKIDIYIYIYINIKAKNYIDRIIVKESTIKNNRNKVTYSNTKQTRQNKAKKKKQR